MKATLAIAALLLLTVDALAQAAPAPTDSHDYTFSAVCAGPAEGGTWTGDTTVELYNASAKLTTVVLYCGAADPTPEEVIPECTVPSEQCPTNRERHAAKSVTLPSQATSFTIKIELVTISGSGTSVRCAFAGTSLPASVNCGPTEQRRVVRTRVD
jgi:hypothetical protein